MNRIQKLFSNPQQKLIPFFTAGYPSLDSTVKLVCAAADAGADMVEIGIPFSDPLADGPVIQASSQKALENGMSSAYLFSQLKNIRNKTNIPIALMGSYNPIIKMGKTRFLDQCAASEVDGIILPDLPLDEAEPFCTSAKLRDISPILLVAPNTTNDRIRLISEMAGDLIYAVSILGITGDTLSSKENLKVYLSRVKNNSTTPFIVGFGINTHEDVVWFNKNADGAVVGTAIINNISNSTQYIESTKTFIQTLKGIK